MRNRPIILALPDNVSWGDILWAPDETELELERAMARQQYYNTELRRVELAEQRAWLVAATQRTVAAGLLINDEERKLALREEIDRTDRWWADTVKREKAQTESLMSQYQKILDRGVFEKMKARAEKAKASMDRDNARIERLELLRRGVVRGRRK